MRLVILFLAMFMLFFLYLIPIVFPFGITKAELNMQPAIGFAYAGWYAMSFALTILFGDTVRRNGCWFFKS